MHIPASEHPEEIPCSLLAKIRPKATRVTKESDHSFFLLVAQALALVPGVSRSGATISAGLLRDLDRVTATRLSFFRSGTKT